MAKSKRKRFKPDLYNVATIFCIVVIIVSVIIIIKPNKKMTPYGVEIVQESKYKNKEITEDDAKEIAIKQFKILGENTTADQLEIIKLKRNNELYYHVASHKNNLEIKINGGEITRINAASVDE